MRIVFRAFTWKNGQGRHHFVLMHLLPMADHAFREFQGAAAEGDAYAMFNLGYMYLRGVGTPQVQISRAAA